MQRVQTGYVKNDSQQVSLSFPKQAKFVYRKIIRQHAKRTPDGSAISEFGPAFIILIMLFLFPFINLIVFGAGVATVQGIANQVCRTACTAESRTDAIAQAKKKEQMLLNTGFGHFLQLSPATGLGIPGTGCILEVVRSPTGDPATQLVTNISFGSPLPVNSGPTGPNNTGANQTAFLYQYRVRASYNIQPLLNMSAVPFVSQIPAVGKASTMDYVSSGQVENVLGLDR